MWGVIAQTYEVKMLYIVDLGRNPKFSCGHCYGRTFEKTLPLTWKRFETPRFHYSYGRPDYVWIGGGKQLPALASQRSARRRS